MVLAIPFPDIAPEIFSVSLGTFTFALRWYALAYIVGIVIGWRLVAGLMRRETLWSAGRAPLTAQGVDDLVTAVVLGIILGGRIGYVLFYQPGAYAARPWEALYIWQGGMSFHGGLVGVTVGLLWTAWRHGAPVLQIADALGVAVPPGIFLGRLANFINAELWGHPTDLPWGVVFPGDAAQACAGVAGACARHPSQLYEAALEGLLLGGVLLWLALRGGLRRPGLIAGLFLAGYALARMFVELFRQADAQFTGPGNPLGRVLQAGEVGLSMGQLLSLPMLLVGIALVVRARGRPPALA